MYQIKRISLIPISLELLHPFKTAHHTVKNRPLTIVVMQVLDQFNGQIVKGYGEVQSFDDFSYASENQYVSREVLKTLLLPQLKRYSFSNPESFSAYLNQLTPFASFAKAALEMAVWDALGKFTQQSLQQMIHGQGKEVAVGLAVGLTDQLDFNLVQKYQRIKIKIDGRTNDFKALSQLLERYPKQRFSIDANSSFTIDNMKQADDLPDNIDFIEQPFGETDFVEHAKMQAEIKKNISLDESVNNISDVYTMLQCRSANALTVKQGKIGGISNALLAIRLVSKPWIGGMLTSGLGRSVDLALSSLPKIAFPGDISDSLRYFQDDIIKEHLTVENGTIKVPNNYGIGATMDFDVISNLQVADTFTINY
ncbi:o-succinylbenzoate synthase [Leuconostoc litchii]|uniref:o-succinylbenzoate synthase n=1 Tax=Leuconostoc litchii TaxID=1981069 RepID=A0A6P2CMU0_9LACO|nr:o-succinylbenzoate synthase [Leuconostoc litchii]TYC47186.1 o-succinylbenzoate synthase [Leuconostoc litchii]GMA69151.1 o-succinylbenzoate synthase [Leuconostoc litchii]